MTDLVVLSLLEEPPDDDRGASGLLAAPAGWPAPPGEATGRELLGEIVRRIAPHTEADRATRGRTLRVNTQDRRVD